MGILCKRVRSLSKNERKTYCTNRWAGSGLGVSLAHVFCAVGYQVIGLNRSVSCDLSDHMIMKQVNLGDSSDVVRCIDDIVESTGVPEVVIHNPAELYIKSFLDTTNEEFQQA